MHPAAPEALVREVRLIAKREGYVSRYLGVGWDERQQKWKAMVKTGDVSLQVGLHSNEATAALLSPLTLTTNAAT